MADIVAFARRSTDSGAANPTTDHRPEVIVFPRTNIRVLRRLWGLPEYGLLVAGPDGRAIGALDEGVAG